MTATLPLDRVRVNGRHRQNLGDLESLVESIGRDGLFHPVVVTEDGELLAGHRRLEAVRSLGWDEVPVTRVRTLGDARQRLRIERDENTCRLDMAPSEKVRLGLALEELERPKAAERKAANLKEGPERKSFPNGEPSRGERTGKVYDLVGESVGMSGTTYKRAKTVIEAADAGKASAQEALAEMDATGKVNPAYRKVTNQPPPRRKPVDVTGARNRNVALKSKERIEKAVGNCNGIARGFDGLKADWALAVAEREEVDGWDQSFKEASAAIGRLRKRLKETP